MAEVLYISFLIIINPVIFFLSHRPAATETGTRPWPALWPSSSASASPWSAWRSFAAPSPPSPSPSPSGSSSTSSPRRSLLPSVMNWPPDKSISSQLRKSTAQFLLYWSAVLPADSANWMVLEKNFFWWWFNVFWCSCWGVSSVARSDGAQQPFYTFLFYLGTTPVTVWTISVEFIVFFFRIMLYWTDGVLMTEEKTNFLMFYKRNTNISLWITKTL